MQVDDLLNDRKVLDLDDSTLSLIQEESEEFGAGETSPSSRKKRVLKKAPDAPKRFKSAYILYVMNKMDEIKKSLNPEVKVTEVMKKLAAMWKVLPQSERKPFEDIANADKERYFQELSTYSGPMQVPNKRRKKNPCAPKRAMSAFLSYSQAMRPIVRAEFAGMKNSEVSVVLAQRWKSATDVEKEPHLERERIDRQQYYRDLAVWREAEERIKEEASESSSTADFLDLSGKLFWSKVDVKNEAEASSDKTSTNEFDDDDCVDTGSRISPVATMMTTATTSRGQRSQLMEWRNSCVVDHKECDFSVHCSGVSGCENGQRMSQDENGGTGGCAETSSHASCSTGATSCAALSSVSSSLPSSCTSSLSSNSTRNSARKARGSECVLLLASSEEGSTDGSSTSSHRDQRNIGSFSEDTAGLSDHVHCGLNAYVNYMDNRACCEMPGDDSVYSSNGQSESVMQTKAQSEMHGVEANAHVAFSFTPQEILDFLAVPTWSSTECVAARDFPAFSVGYEEGLSRTLNAARCAGFYDGVAATTVSGGDGAGSTVANVGEDNLHV